MKFDQSQNFTKQINKRKVCFSKQAMQAMKLLIISKHFEGPISLQQLVFLALQVAVFSWFVSESNESEDKISRKMDRHCLALKMNCLDLVWKIEFMLKKN